MAGERLITGIAVDDATELTLVELSSASGRPSEWVMALVEEGILEPIGADRAHWRFRGASLRRVQIVKRLESDLGVNLPGAALALELLDELERLRARLRWD